MVIPDIMLESPAASKAIYLFLAGQGTVSYSSRELADILGFSQPTVSASFARIIEAGLVEFEKEPRERCKPVFRTLTVEEWREKTFH